MIAIAGPAEAARLAQGLEYIHASGFKTKIALDPSKYYGRSDHLFASDSATARAQALRELLADPEVSVIMAARGAYGSMEVLAELPRTFQSDNYKPIIGFSDPTALLVGGYAHSGAVNIHGPSVESCSKASVDQDVKRSFESLLSLLSGTSSNPFEDVTLSHLCGGSSGEGRLIGGNLSLLSHLMGTPWQPSFDNHILFLEDTREKPYRVHRYLLQMKLAGMFNKLSGVVLGAFTDCADAKGAPLEQVFLDIFQTFGFPVLKGLPVGHQALNLPVPIGIKARISKEKLEILERTVLE